MRGLFFLWIIVNLFACQSKKKEQQPIFSSFLIDYIHQPSINIKLYNADVFKWQGDYINALDAYQQIETSELSQEEWLYLKNQEVYVLLKMHKPKTIKPILDSLSQNHLDLIIQHKGLKADYLFNQAMYWKEKFNPEKTLNLLKEAVLNYDVIYEKNHFKYAECLNEIGLLYRFYTFHTDSTYKYIDTAFNLVKRNPEINLIKAPFYFAKANSSRFKREHNKGLVYVKRAIEVAQQGKWLDKILLTRCYTLQGYFLKKMDAYEEAINSFDIAEGYTESDSFPTQFIQEFLREKALLFIAKKEENRFFQTFQELEQLLKQQNTFFVYPNELKGYHAYLIKQDYLSAIKYYQQFLTELRPYTPGATLVTTANWILIDSYQKTGKFQMAEKYAINEMLLGSSLKSSDITFDDIVGNNLQGRKTLFGSYALLANFYYNDAKKNNRLSSLEKAFQLQTFVDSSFFQNTYLFEEEAILNIINDFGKKFYNTAVATCVQLHNLKKETRYLDWMSLFIERLKSFLLYQEVIAQSQFNIANIPKDTLRKIRDLKFEISKQKIQATRDKKSIEVLEKLLLEQNRLDNYLYNQFPSLIALQVKQKIPTLSEIIDYSKAYNTGFLQLQLDKEHLNLLFIGKDTVMVKQQLNSIKIEKTILKLLNLMERPQYSLESKQAFFEHSGFLYNLLIQPFAPFIKEHEHLLIIPDGIFRQIPFEVLSPNNHKQIDNYKERNYLFKTCTVKYSSSLKSFFLNQAKKWNHADIQTILGYAFSEKRSNINGKKIGKLPPLIKSHQELEVIIESFPAANYIFKRGENNSKEHFLDNAHGKDLIHLSLHAQSSFQSRLANKIHFSNKKFEENTLMGYELLALELNAYLVVLSACQSAYGSFEHAEGAFSLSRSFFQTGVKNVVASFWSAQEETSLTIFTLFYQNLAKGQSPSVALHNAKLKLLTEKDEFQLHPSLWANYICFEG